jgi:hypothetical protein
VRVESDRKTKELPAPKRENIKSLENISSLTPVSKLSGTKARMVL